MDGIEFDRLSRAFVTGTSRRRLLGLLSSLPLAGLLSSGRNAAAKPDSKTHRHHAQPRSHHAKAQRPQDQPDDTHAEACIPTGQRCPAKKPRGKHAKKLSCQRCCQRATTSDANGKAVCACKPNGSACTPDTAFTCCSGICPNGVCSGVAKCPVCSGTTPICQGSTCVTCTSTSQCPASTVCAPSGACAPCTVTGGGTALATAVAAAQDGDTFYVCAGTYTGGFAINQRITLIGAGQGTDGTIIQGGNPVVQINAGTAAQPVTLERLTIQNGIEGVFIVNGRALTLRDGTVRGNEGAPVGAGMNNQRGTLVLTRCTVEANRASIVGGGLVNDGGPATLTDCLIQGNEAGAGGGIFNFSAGALMTLTRTRVTANTATSGVRSGIANSGNNGATVTLLEGSTVCANHPTTNQCVNVTGPGCTDTCPGS